MIYRMKAVGVMTKDADTAHNSSLNSDTASKQRGLLIVMTGASGVGKGTLREQWLANQNVFCSISWTTREARPGEIHGEDYIFVSKEEFLEKVASQGFLEHAEFVGNHYGTPIEPIEDALARGQDVVLEIEVDGAMQVKKLMGEQAILIFVMPPSLTELRRRLTGRATETPERIEKRLARAREEIMKAHEFRYAIINDDLGRAVGELLALQQAERAEQLPEYARTDSDDQACQVAKTVRSTTFSEVDLQHIVDS